jgi:hypothetical protein
MPPRMNLRHFLPLLLLASSASAQLRQEVKGKSLKIFRGDTLVTEYRTDHHLPYLYPLVGPAGNNLTRNFPMNQENADEQQDHPHHRSFWFTHGLVNGHDFWHSPDHKSSITHQSFENLKDGGFTANLTWDHDGKTLLNEKRSYLFEMVNDKSMSVKVTSVFTATEDVTFGDTKEGSFALRVAPTLRTEGKAAKGHLANSEGQKDGDVWGKRAEWISCYGPDSTGQATVISMMDHPSNLRHPTYWHARSYGLLAANPFGVKDFTKKGNGDHLIKKGQTLTQRYCVFIQSGDFKEESVRKAYSAFSGK